MHAPKNIGSRNGLVFRAAFAVALVFPARNARGKSKRAAAFAANAERVALNHGPTVLAVVVNLAIVVLLGAVTIQRGGFQPAEIEATIGGFFTPDDSGGRPPEGGGAPLQQAVAQASHLTVSTPPVVEFSAITSSVPSPIQFTVPVATPQVSSLVASGATSSSGTGGGARGGVEGGQGSGSGKGIGSGTGRSQNGGSATGAGTGGSRTQGGGGVTSIRGLAGWDLVVLIDHSSMVGDGGGYDSRLSLVRTKAGRKSSQPVKFNAALLPNILAQKNNILEIVNASDDNLVQNHEAGRSDDGFDIKVNGVYRDLGRALEALAAYASRQNTAVIIGSEFQWQSREYSREERAQLEAKLLSYKLPIFFISLAARPDDFIRNVAKNSGGGYLGYISASNAKSMAKAVDTSWTCLMRDGYLTYERRNPPFVRSEEIVAPLEDSEQEGLSFEESDRRARAQQQP